MTYDPAGEPLDPARGEAIVAAAEGTLVADREAARPVARPVTRRTGLSGPARAAAVGGAGILTGLVIAAVLPRRSRRVIVAPAVSRKRRKLRTKRTTSLLVDLHLLDR